MNSQNVPSEVQVRNFLVSKKSCVLFSRYSSFCISNHAMIYRICDARMGIGTCHRVHFWVYLLSHNSLTHQTWPIDRYKREQYFSEIYWTIWRTGAKFQALFNLATCSNYSVTNCVKFPVFPFFERVNKGELKMVNISFYQSTNFTILLFH